MTGTWTDWGSFTPVSRNSTSTLPGFEVETQINVRLARSSLRVVEVPSYEHRRIHGVSNLNAVTDGVRVLRTILRERVRSAPAMLASAETYTPSVSGVLLATNDARAVEEAVTAAYGALSELGLPDFELIVVDDSSNGARLEVVSRLARQLLEVRLLRHETGRHRGTALRSGMRAARCEAVWIVDAAEPGLERAEVRRLLPHFTPRTVVAVPVRKRRKRRPVGLTSPSARGTQAQSADIADGAGDDWAVKLLPRSLGSTLGTAEINEGILMGARQAGYRVLRLPARMSAGASMLRRAGPHSAGEAVLRAVSILPHAGDLDEQGELSGVPMPRTTGVPQMKRPEGTLGARS